MKSKTLLAATLVVPLLVLACNREEPYPTATRHSEEKSAMAPSISPDRALENSPPVAGHSSSPSAANSPASQPGERGKDKAF